MLTETEAIKNKNDTLLSELERTRTHVQQLNLEKIDINNQLQNKNIEWNNVQSLLTENKRENKIEIEQLQNLLEASKIESKNFKLKLKLAVEGALITEVTVKGYEKDLKHEQDRTALLQDELQHMTVRHRNCLEITIKIFNSFPLHLFICF